MAVPNWICRFLNFAAWELSSTFNFLFSSLASEISFSKSPNFVSCSCIFLVSLLFSSRANSWDSLLVVRSFLTLFNSICKVLIVFCISSQFLSFCSKLVCADSYIFWCSVATISSFISSSPFLASSMLASIAFSLSSSFCLWSVSICPSYFASLLQKSWSSSSPCDLVLIASLRSCCISNIFSSSSIRRRNSCSRDVKVSSSWFFNAAFFSSRSSTFWQSSFFPLTCPSHSISNAVILER